MSDGDCILVFGVSGAGKTSSCQDFVDRHPEFLYVRASALLSDTAGVSAEQLRTSAADSIAANQSLLAKSLHRFRQGRRERPLVVDAHAVIDNDQDLVRVPVEVVASLEPAGIILLEAPAAVLMQRRQSNKRSRPIRTTGQLELEIAAERQAVLAYADVLGVPFESGCAIGNFRLDGLISALREKAHLGSINC